MLHSNIIEGLWGSMQRRLKMIYGLVPGGYADVRDFAYEALWRIELEAVPINSQSNLCA